MSIASARAALAKTFHFIEIEASDELSRLATRRENAARPAQAELTVNTSGIGQQRIGTALVFPVIFRNVPHFTTGSAVISNPYPKLWNDPIGSAGIWGWQRDKRGYYTGAYIWTRIEADLLTETVDDEDYPVVVDTPLMKVQHFLTFSGIGIKDIPTLGKTALTSRLPGI